MVTDEELEAAEAALLETKAHRHENEVANRSYQEQAKATVLLRNQWRTQEVAAGRRTPGVGVVIEEED